jgi:hypothetical protein
MTASVIQPLYSPIAQDKHRSLELNAITKLLDTLEIGDAGVSGSLFMFPLFGAATEVDGPLTVDEAVGLDLLEFEEISDAGTVPEIVACNRGPRPVLLLDGEQILGLKQNRTFNVSMLIPPRSKIRVPVSCLEIGRWSARYGKAQAAEHVHFASGRARKLRSVTDSLSRFGTYHSDQAAVWEDVSRKFQGAGAISATSAEADFYENRRDRLEDMRATLKSRPRQIGVAVGIGGRLIGVDLFGSQRLYASLHDKLLKSYLLDAIDVEGSATPPSRAAVSLKIKSLFVGEPTRFDSPGGDESFRWSNRHGCAAALVSAGKCVHAVGFCSQELADADGQAAA